jgi:hypothetical protein
MRSFCPKTFRICATVFHYVVFFNMMEGYRYFVVMTKILVILLSFFFDWQECDRSTTRAPSQKFISKVSFALHLFVCEGREKIISKVVVVNHITFMLYLHNTVFTFYVP